MIKHNADDAASAAPRDANRPSLYDLLQVSLLLLLPLVVLFHSSWLSSQILFSNDGPLGLLSSSAGDARYLFTGFWSDLNWLGSAQPSSSVTLTSMINVLLGPVWYSKIYTPLALWVLGIAAWFFCRSQGMPQSVAILVGFAALLNTNPFSNACWGLGVRALNLAYVFLALAALNSRAKPLLTLPLAGFAVGMGVMEGYDGGAILSLYVAAYALMLTLIRQGTSWRSLGLGIGRIAVIALFAAFIASQSLATLTRNTGVANAAQALQTQEERWDWATQWSLPKIEFLRVIIPGLYGYRMDTPDGGQYWGRVGQQPGWDQHHQGQARHSGAGEYAGLLVALVAAWGLAQGLRSRGSPFSPDERKIILFWAGAALISLLLAFGRFAPLYQLIYPLPFFSSIRNPIKFMFPFHLGLLVLFAYGLLGFGRAYLQGKTAPDQPWKRTLKEWWAQPHSFNHLWVKGMAVFLMMSLLGTLIFAASGSNFERLLIAAGFSAESAQQTFGFVKGELARYLLFLLLGVALLGLAIAGTFRGRARLVWFLMGTLLVLDLARANTPWIRYLDYEYKYASNPIVDLLREEPYTRRVQVLPFGGDQQFGQFQYLYGLEWTQHLFPYYDIQSLDIVMEPRTAPENQAYRDTFSSTNPATAIPLLLRKWELTATGYLLGPGGAMLDQLNQQLDPVQQRFRPLATFSVIPKKEEAVTYEDLTVVLQTNGPLALIEFTGALPRAGLYTNWEVSPEDPATLSKLSDRAFDPHRTVLVAEELPPPAAQPEAGPGRVDYVSYRPKQIQLETECDAPAVLLLNDKYHPDWRVLVDGQPAPLLRCNYLMRGVHLPAGKHLVEFRFQPTVTPLIVSLIAIALGFGLCGVLAVQNRPRQTTSSPT